MNVSDLVAQAAQNHFSLKAVERPASANPALAEVRPIEVIPSVSEQDNNKNDLLKKDAGQNKFDKLKEEVDKNNEVLKMTNQALRFEIDQDADKVVVKIVDKRTGDLIRQIPSEEVLQMEEHLKELLEMSGMLYNHKI